MDSKVTTPSHPEGAEGNWLSIMRSNAVAGFLVFLIALPLCLAIAKASLFPPVAGVITAIIGGLITPWISNSQLTIKGPAAGLIVIVAGCVSSFGWVENDPVAQMTAYRCALAVGVVAGVLQVVLGLFRGGVISEIFPTTVVHGMLASIGIIIIAKQSHVMLGATPHAKEPIELLLEIPHTILHGMNPEIALIGIASITIMALWPRIKVAGLKSIAAPLLVVGLTIPMGMYFQLNSPIDHPHKYLFGSETYTVSEKNLVEVPRSMLDAIHTPDFSQILTTTGLTWVMMFFLIGSLESILSAKAVDLLDPQKRRTDFNRDLLGIGVANTLAAALGGLPMISEIVRSRANIDNGAQNKYSNMFHGLFLLVFLALAPSLIHRIPLASLAAMLVFTGFRLASPREFMHMYKLGSDQLTVFVSTIIGVLATDLLIGILIGTAVEIGLHLLRGADFASFFRVRSESRQEGEASTIHVKNSLVFSSWLPLRQRLQAVTDSNTVVLDLSETTLVDHTVMEKLHQMQQDWQLEGKQLVLRGLDEHIPASSHPHSVQRRPK